MTPDRPTSAPLPADRPLGELVLDAARTSGQRPLVTFTDGGTGERTELGCATFENWVAKTANLLVDELGLAPGGVLATALGTSWSAVVVMAAAWRVGALVALPGADVDADAVASLEGPDAPPPGEAVPRLLVGSGLGARLLGEAGDAVPFAEEVLAFPDDFDGPVLALDAPALLAPGGGGPEVRTHAELLAAAGAMAADAGVGQGDRYASTIPLDGPEGVVAGPVLALLLGGGLVLAHAVPGADLARLLAAERCAALLAPAGTVPGDAGVRTVEVTGG